MADLILDDEEPQQIIQAPKGRGKARHLKSAVHVMKCPGMTIDGNEQISRDVWVLNDNGYEVSKVNTSIPYGLERIFIEPIGNVCDHGYHSRLQNYPPGIAIVVVTTNSIYISNAGLPMTIEINPETGWWTPDVLFGKLRSGTNFDKFRFGGGVNGYGIKLSNIFSFEFNLRVINHLQRFEYIQKWYLGKDSKGEPLPMIKAGDPIMRESSESNSTVSIQFSPNLPFFGYQSAFPPEAIGLFRRHVADASFTTGMAFEFNNQKFQHNLISYAKLYFPELNDSRTKFLIHYEWPEGTPVRKNPDGTQTAENGQYPIQEMIIVDVPSKGRTIGFSNCISNPEGGTHIDAAIRAVTEAIVETLQKKYMKKMKIKDDEDEKKKKVPKLSLRDLRKSLGIIFSARVVNPMWNGNPKSKLLSPEVKVKFPIESIEQIKKWTLIKRLETMMEGKRQSILNVMKHDKIPRSQTKFEDAGLAGTSHDDIVAAFVEGGSAKNYVVTLTGMWPGGREKLGILSLKGKLPNAYKSPPETLVENKEYRSIIKMLGIEVGVDYTLHENFRKLRYRGGVIFLTDADKDGSHIKGLIISLFNRYFPTLLQRGYIRDYRTPSRRAYKGDQVFSFYDDDEFDAWKEQIGDDKGWTIKWFKGLGNSDKVDVIQDFQKFNVVTFYYDENANAYIELAFGKDRGDQRKMWLESYNPNLKPPPIINKILPISQFFHFEFIKYGIYCLDRHIPGMDGLNLAQRKTIYGAFKQWGNKLTGGRDTKMSTFVGDVSECSGYHHGDALGKVITRMGGHFVGLNNIPFFKGHGMFGSRDEGGKDAASIRYLTIAPNTWFLSSVFRFEDNDILNYLNDDGEQVEPKFYLPIIPLHILQGAAGISFGWNSMWASHHLLDIVDFLVALNDHRKPEPFDPYYPGFTGNVSIIDNRGENPNAFQVAISGSSGSQSESEGILEESEHDDSDVEKIDDIILDDEDIINKEYEGETEVTIAALSTQKPKKGHYSVMTTGVITQLGFDSAVVIDLPIGLWMASYREQLAKNKDKGRLSRVVDRCDEIKIYFGLEGISKTDKNGNRMQIHFNDLGLVRYFSLTNLVLLDEESHPKRHASVEAAMYHFHEWRFPYYIKRKEKMIENMIKQIKDIDSQLSFIEAILQGRILLFNPDKSSRDKEVIINEIRAMGLDEKFYRMAFSKTSKSAIQKLQAKRAKYMKDIDDLKETSPYRMWNRDLDELKKGYIKIYGDNRSQRTDDVYI